MEGVLIIGYDFSNGRAINALTVGKQNNDKVEIINIFYGGEASDIYQKLTTVNEEVE